jgi:oligopeptide transport system permease protein
VKPANNTTDSLNGPEGTPPRVGESLGRDAWRQFRKNRVANFSLYFLISILLLAVFTPVLPLQSPQVQHLGDKKRGIPSKQFRAPNLQPHRLEMVDAESTRTPLSKVISDGNSTSDPILQIWNDPGRLDQLLIRVRLAIFGDWSMPSICGSDHLGRDILSRLFWGARVSLAVGIIAALVSLVIGVLYGAVAGFQGGSLDNLMMRFVDVLYSVPFIFVVIFLVTILSEESIKQTLLTYGVDQITIFYIVIGAIYWLTMARVVRGQVISIKNELFVESARACGASNTSILIRHIIPNVISVVIVYLTLTIPSVMLFEAFLSFLGLGVEPPNVSWGLLANDGIQAITPIRIHWWLVLFPGLALSTTLLALNFLGDGLRDALDPKMNNR